MKKTINILLLSLALAAGSHTMMAQSTGVSQRVESAASVIGSMGHITFNAGNSDTVFRIYSITGQLIKTVKVSADGHVTIDMPKGFYVVRCDGQWSRKVIVK